METAADAALEKPIVIVLDDDPAVLKSLEFLLELEGFSVRPYADAAELLNEAGLPASGCLVIDYDLPILNGLQVLQRLRSRQVCLPAIVTTLHPSSTLREHATAAGVAIVETPLFNHTLTDSIRAALAQQVRFGADAVVDRYAPQS